MGKQPEQAEQPTNSLNKLAGGADGVNSLNNLPNSLEGGGASRKVASMTANPCRFAGGNNNEKTRKSVN